MSFELVPGARVILACALSEVPKGLRRGDVYVVDAVERPLFPNVPTKLILLGQPFSYDAILFDFAAGV